VWWRHRYILLIVSCHDVATSQTNNWALGYRLITRLCCVHACELSYYCPWLIDVKLHPHRLKLDLHWLPVQYGIQYKLAVITFNALTSRQPSFLMHDLIRSRSSTRQLRSDGQGLLQVDRVKSVFAERAFRHCAPTVWNSLPQHLISDLSNFPTFIRHLKIELHRRAFLRWSVTVPYLRFFTTWKTKRALTTV